MAAAAVFIVLATVGVAVFVPDQFVRGLLIGGLVTGTSMAILMLVSQATGADSTNMGATAEQWTASELRQLPVDDWIVINHVSLRPWDIDHVVVGRAGIFAVETKWSSTGWNLERPDPYLRSAIEQVKRNARDLRMWKEVRDAGLAEVLPVLFLWGGFVVTKPAEPMIIDGVTVIYGQTAAEAWRSRVPGQRRVMLDEEVLERLWTAFDRQVVTRDDIESTENATLPSIERLWWTGLGAFVVGSAGLFLSLWALQSLDSWWRWGIVELAETIAALVGARRWQVLKPYAAGWLIGLIGSAAVIITSFLAAAS